MSRALLLLSSLILCFSSYAQKTISGQVFGDSLALAGATIQIKDSQKGVISDMDGYFNLKAKPDDVLLVSYLGFKTATLAIDDSESIEFHLNSGIALDEVFLDCYLSCRKICCGAFCTVIEVYDISYAPQIRVYPNPSPSGHFTISSRQVSRIMQFAVYDFNGRILKEQKFHKALEQTKLNLSSEPSGIYLIRMDFEDGSHEVRKLIKT